MISGENAIRITNLVLLILIAILLVKDQRDKPSALFGAALSICIGCDLALSLLPPWLWPREFWRLLLHVGSIGSFVAFWLFTKSVFEDRFKWRWYFLTLFVLLEALHFFGYFATDGYQVFTGLGPVDSLFYKLTILPQQILVLVLLGLTVYAALKDWRNDLVESRRRFRSVFFVLGALLALSISFVSYFGLGTQPSPTSDLVAQIVLLVLIVVVLARYFGVREDYVSGRKKQPFESATPVSSSDKTMTNLLALIVANKVYRETGLTITQLSQKLAVAEHKLRQIINGNLGFRNFNQFLNHYRIEDSQQQLLALKTRHLPVLSIALDVGYRSLAPFNKAFKEITGMTPTEYRKQNLNDSLDHPA